MIDQKSFDRLCLMHSNSELGLKNGSDRLFIKDQNLSFAEQ